MLHRHGLALIGLLAALTLIGCGGKKTTPVVYAPAFDVTDLAQPLQVDPDGYFLLTQEKTVDRFACTLALARHHVLADPNGPRLPLVESKPGVEAHWTESFRGISAIRDVMFLEPTAMRAYHETPEARCVVAAKLGAALLLDYAVGQTGPNTGRVVGVLYDTRTAQPLATIQTEDVITNKQGVEVPPKEIWEAADDDEVEHPDIRDYDATYQAQRQFERYTVAVIRELIELDKPAPTTQPHRWTPGVRN